MQEGICHGDIRKSILPKSNRWMSESGNAFWASFLWLNVWFSIIAWGHIFQTYPVGSSTCTVEYPGRSFWFCKAHQDAGIIYLELQCTPRNRIWFRIVADVFSNLETSQLLKTTCSAADTPTRYVGELRPQYPQFQIPLCLPNIYFSNFRHNLKFQSWIQFYAFKRETFNTDFQIFFLIKF